MIREVDLVSYLPPFLAEYRELKAALEAEDPEFALVWRAADRALSNEFIATADEYGISRFEKLLRLCPSQKDTLEERRKRILGKWFASPPYTERMLFEKLTLLCGENHFWFTKRYAEYQLEIGIVWDVFNLAWEVKKIISDMLPCNLTAVIKTKVAKLDHSRLERFRGSRIRIGTALTFWWLCHFLDGAWALNGKKLLDANRGQSLHPRLILTGWHFAKNNEPAVERMRLYAGRCLKGAAKGNLRICRFLLRFWKAAETEGGGTIRIYAGQSAATPGIRSGLIIRKNLWYLNGAKRLDETELLNAEIKKEEL